MSKKKPEVETAKGDFTPMIDCIFLLLIFFMCATKFKVEEKKLEMNIPRSGGPSSGKDTPIIIELDSRGNVSLNGGSVTIEQLSAQLKSLLQDRPKEKWRVTVDGRETSYGKVMRVINICNKNKVTDITFKLS